LYQRLKPHGTKATDRGSNLEATPPANLGREIVTYGIETKRDKTELKEPEEIPELKMPGFVCVFGCNDYANLPPHLVSPCHSLLTCNLCLIFSRPN